MKTTVKQLIEKFDAWSNEPKDDRLSREVVADLIREAIAAKESGELTEPEPELEPAKDLVPARPWGIEDTGQNLWVGPLRVDGKINEIVFHIPLAGLKAGSAARHRKSAKLIVAAVNAYKAQETCGTCQGKKAVDSGGVTPWGSEILVPCPECADAPKDLIPPTPWRWEAKGDWITMLNAKGGLVFGLPLPPSQREQLQHLFACIAFSVNKCNSEANSEPFDITKGISQIPESLNLTETIGWQEAKHRLDDLDRKQRVDRDRIAILEKRLAKLEAKADAPATPQLFTPEMWAIIEKFSKEHAVASKIAPLMRELKKQGAYDTEIATPDPDGWQPLTETNHPPWSHGICYELKGGSTRAWYFYDDQALRCAIADGATHWRVPKTDEAKGQP